MRSSLILNAGQTLRMNFSVPPTTDTDFLDTEVPFLPFPLSPDVPAMSCRLFNGDVLLGSGACKENWQSATAAFPVPDVPTVDFSSIALGSNALREDFMVTSGSVVFELDGNVGVSRTTGPNVPPNSNLRFVATGTITSFVLLSGSCQ